MTALERVAAKLPAKKVKLDRYHDLRIVWRDDTVSVYPVRELRKACPCASCRELRDQAKDPFRIVGADEPMEDVHVDKMEPVGHYALNFRFSDGHATGIFSYEYLIEIAPSFDKG